MLSNNTFLVLLAHFNKGLRWKTAFKTDERVRLMNEIISGIQVIKMYAWEFAFCSIINTARRCYISIFLLIFIDIFIYFPYRKEMRILVQTSYIRGVVMSMIMFTARSAIFVTLISMVNLFNSNITSENVFIISGYYIIMRASMTVFFPQGVTQVYFIFCINIENENYKFWLLVCGNHNNHPANSRLFNERGCHTGRQINHRS